MMQHLTNIRKGTYYWLGIIPVIYLLLGNYFNHLIGLPSLRNMDPEYIYFISGISLSEGRLDIGHIDNPGTPLQFLAAIIFRITYLFRPQSVPYLEDLFTSPDLYMNILNHVIIGIVSVCLYIGGLMATRISGFLPYGLILQSSPFYSEITYDIVGRVVPELIIPIPVIFTMVVILKMLYGEKAGMRNVLILAFLSAMGMSIKFTYVSLWILPLVTIPGWKKKGWFLLFSTVFLALLALPATLEIGTIWRWLTRLFFHSGQYGAGDPGFINTGEFVRNLSYIYRVTRPFYILLFVLPAIALIYWFLKKKEVPSNWMWVTTAIILTVTLHTALSSKHYAYRYMIPAISLMPLMVILVAEAVKGLIPHRLTMKILFFVLIALFIPGAIKQAKAIRYKSYHIEKDVKNRMETWHFAQSLGDNNIRLIASKSYGSPFIDYTMMFCDAWSGKPRALYRPVFKKLYPDSYMFFTWDNSMRFWNDRFDTTGILLSDKPVYLYLEKGTREMFDRSIGFFFSPSIPADSIAADTLFKNQYTGEGIYQLRRK